MKVQLSVASFEMEARMKTIAARARALIGTSGLLAGLTLAGCGLFGPSAEQFLIRVDSIAVPSSLAAGDTLTAHFYGRIGPDGCSRLARVDKQVTSASLDIAFTGEHRVPGGTDCIALSVAMNHAEVVAPPLGAPFVITVRQPDGSVLRRTVDVQ
jgi:hypothetical protein